MSFQSFTKRPAYGCVKTQGYRLDTRNSDFPFPSRPSFSLQGKPTSSALRYQALILLQRKRMYISRFAKQSHLRCIRTEGLLFPLQEHSSATLLYTKP